MGAAMCPGCWEAGAGRHFVLLGMVAAMGTDEV